MNDSASAADDASIRRPPPSTYLWTADGRIRERRRPIDADRTAPRAGGNEQSAGPAV